MEDAIGIENNITTKARMRSPFASSLSFSWLYSSPCFFFLNLPAVNRPTIDVKIAVALVANGATSAVFGTFFVDVFAEVTFFPDEMPAFPLSAFTAAFVFLPSLRSSTVVAVTFLVEESPPVMPAFFL